VVLPARFFIGSGELENLLCTGMGLERKKSDKVLEFFSRTYLELLLRKSRRLLNCFLLVNRERFTRNINFRFQFVG